MKALALSLAALLLAGQIPASPPSGAMQQPPPRGIPGEEQVAQAPKLHVVAVHATGDGTAREPLEEALSESASVRKALEALPFDRYEAVTDEEVEAPMNEDTLVPLNGIYTLHATPTGQDEAGALLLETRVDMLDPASGAEENYLNAIYTHAQLASGMPLIFRGLDLNVGELVVVLCLAGDENQQGESQSGQQNPEGEESDDEKHEDQEQQGDQPQEPQEQQESRAPEEQDEETQDLENIEALLQSLEERDREEQEDQQKVRTGIRVRGDWW